MIWALHRSTRKKGRWQRPVPLVAETCALCPAMPEPLQAAGKVTPDTHPAGEPSWEMLPAGTLPPEVTAAPCEGLESYCRRQH